jgi:hypothetical protein
VAKKGQPGKVVRSSSCPSNPELLLINPHALRSTGTIQAVLRLVACGGSLIVRYCYQTPVIRNRTAHALQRNKLGEEKKPQKNGMK